MEPESPQLSVWLCQEEKLISGLSKRTTCADVVRVLLADSRPGGRRGGRPRQPAPVRQLPSLQEGAAGPGLLSGAPQCYCIVEKWRGFERTLPNKTKLLRLWAAWGDEQENVRFVLVRSDASLPNAGPRSAEARVVPSKERPGGTVGAPSLALSQERQRRVVRKAFRKLAKINKRRGQPTGSPSSSSSPPPPEGCPAAQASASAGERMETLVHLVLSQDHTIRQQVKRLHDLDREIDRYEARIHFERMKRHGVNYVQETYLDGGQPEPAAASEEASEAEASAASGDCGALAEYARRCAQVARVQEQRSRQEELLEQLGAQIQAELNERWMKRRREELADAALAEADCDTTELAGGGAGELPVEQERVRTQLSTSLYIGLRLSTDLDALKADLAGTQRAWDDKERELRGLIHALEGAATDPGDPQPAPSPAEEGWAEPSGRTFTKADCEEEEEGGGEGNDEDSDTGLSSMHSQDSDSVPPVCESLV